MASDEVLSPEQTDATSSRVPARLSTRLAESIAATLRERILREPLPGGMLPKQEELMAEFGVSAPSIREALRVLETEGLVTIRRGRFGGAYVHRPDSSSTAYALGLALHGMQVTLDDVAESLRALEPLSAVSCAQRPDRNTTVVPRLEKNLLDSEDALGGPEFTHHSRQFHDLLVAHMTNATIKLLLQSVVSLWGTQEELWAHAMAEVGQYPDRSEQRRALSAHKKITAAIAAGDAPTAEDVSRRHLAAVQKRTVLGAFGGQPVDAASPSATNKFRRTSPVGAAYPATAV